jgi:cellobiose-specific phosphotransferase system component IIC
MTTRETIDEITQLQINYSLKAAQMNLAHAEEQLTLKKVRWYECVLFGGAGITIGLALAKIFLL